MLRLSPRLRCLAALVLLASACADTSSSSSKTAAAPAKAPEKTDAPAPAKAPEKTDAPAPTGKCDVTVTAGADAPATEVEAGKTYCIGEVRLNRDTKPDDVKDKLTDCKVDGEYVGETRLQCKGVMLSFGGPVQLLSRIVPKAG
ncbi:hypothetical protein OV203_26420 [Nannocystis sp. ILAH1]|uniref:hypothetical protein n=1 Tax=Nannocystis sp. ILAH1 TaxID=2996789 RepID=UPI0022703C21|nr:hypothetical protein [Nannocystis sp. ILAH1]MCY0990707.1 hypothetical protein [Nannocystis sp. ILAH1]